MTDELLVKPTLVDTLARFSLSKSPSQFRYFDSMADPGSPELPLTTEYIEEAWAAVEINPARISTAGDWRSADASASTAINTETLSVQEPAEQNPDPWSTLPQSSTSHPDPSANTPADSEPAPPCGVWSATTMGLESGLKKALRGDPTLASAVARRPAAMGACWKKRTTGWSRGKPSF